MIIRNRFLSALTLFLSSIEGVGQIPSVKILGPEMRPEDKSDLPHYPVLKYMLSSENLYSAPLGPVSQHETHVYFWGRDKSMYIGEEKIEVPNFTATKLTPEFMRKLAVAVDLEFMHVYKKDYPKREETLDGKNSHSGGVTNLHLILEKFASDNQGQLQGLDDEAKTCLAFLYDKAKEKTKSIQKMLEEIYASAEDGSQSLKRKRSASNGSELSIKIHEDSPQAGSEGDPSSPRQVNTGPQQPEPEISPSKANPSGPGLELKGDDTSTPQQTPRTVSGSEGHGSLESSPEKKPYDPEGESVINAIVKTELATLFEKCILQVSTLKEADGSGEQEQAKDKSSNDGTGTPKQSSTGSQAEERTSEPGDGVEESSTASSTEVLEANKKLKEEATKEGPQVLPEETVLVANGEVEKGTELDETSVAVVTSSPKAPQQEVKPEDPQQQLENAAQVSGDNADPAAQGEQSERTSAPEIKILVAEDQTEKGTKQEEGMPAVQDINQSSVSPECVQKKENASGQEQPLLEEVTLAHGKAGESSELDEANVVVAPSLEGTKDQSEEQQNPKPEDPSQVAAGNTKDSAEGEQSERTSPSKALQEAGPGTQNPAQASKEVSETSSPTPPEQTWEEWRDDTGGSTWLVTRMMKRFYKWPSYIAIQIGIGIKSAASFVISWVFKLCGSTE